MRPAQATYTPYSAAVPHAYRAQAWLRSHVISFTFLGDELLPNPDFGFPAD
jgi:hypothetical protein